MSILPDRMYHMGGVPVGMEVLQPAEVRWLYSATTAVAYQNLSKTVDLNNLHATLALAEAATTAGQNEVVFVTPNETHELAASVTWDNNDTHLIGMSLNPLQPHVDFTMAAGSGFDPMITISGRGGYFANMTFRHGSPTTAAGATGNVGDLTCATISGRYNYFDNVYFMTPMYGEQDVAATYKGVQVTGHNNYFRGCRFGGDGTARDKANYNLYVSGIGNVFEHCHFIANLSDTTPLFAYLDNVIRDMRYTMFKECTFIAYSAGATPASAMTTAIDGGEPGGNSILAVLDRCNFVNVTNVAAGTFDQRVWISTIGDTAATEATGIAKSTLES